MNLYTFWYYSIHPSSPVYVLLVGEGASKTVVVCANKVDANHGNLENLVDDTEARLWAELHGFPYCETSACTGQGVGDMFQVTFKDSFKQVSRLKYRFMF